MKQIKTLEDLQKIREEALRKVNIRSDRSGTRITVAWQLAALLLVQTCDDGHLDELEKRNVDGCYRGRNGLHWTLQV